RRIARDLQMEQTVVIRSATTWRAVEIGCGSQAPDGCILALTCDIIRSTSLTDMRHTLRLSVVLVATTAAATAGDPNCPKYPSAVRTEMEESLSLDREFQSYSRAARARAAARSARSHLADSGNFIDQLLARKMDTDGVTPAPRTSDTEFLRRIYLDLTG